MSSVDLRVGSYCILIKVDDDVCGMRRKRNGLHSEKKGYPREKSGLMVEQSSRCGLLPFCNVTVLSEIETK